MKSSGGKIIKPLKFLWLFLVQKISKESRELFWIESPNNYFFNLVRSVKLYFLSYLFLIHFLSTYFSIVYVHGRWEWKRGLCIHRKLSSYDNSEKIKIKTHEINITVNHYNYHYKRVIITEEDCSPIALVSLSKLTRLGLSPITRYSILVSFSLD